MAAYSDLQVKYIKELRDSGRSWEDVTKAFNDRFDDNKTFNAIRKTYKRFEDSNIDDDSIIKSLEKSRRAEVANRKLRKEQNVLLDKQLALQDVIDTVKDLISTLQVKKFNIAKPKKSTKKNKKKKPKMVIEPLISDIHYGLKTKTYNAGKARTAMKKMAQLSIEEMERYSKSYTIEKFNILLNGDLIQSATMHKDSGKACEMTNAQQIALAIESLFNDFILPIALTGHKVDIIGMCGNHDRESVDRPTVDPGITYFTYAIYKALEQLAIHAGLKNVNFNIPTESYLVYEIFGSHFLLEHGDSMRQGTLKELETQINKRSVQCDKLIKGIRVGHFHNDTVANIGRYIKNGSPVSDDHYGNMLGYKSRPCQLINYYVETDRDTPYYHTLVVNLE